MSDLVQPELIKKHRTCLIFKKQRFAARLQALQATGALPVSNPGTHTPVASAGIW